MFDSAKCKIQGFFPTNPEITESKPRTPKPQFSAFQYPQSENNGENSLPQTWFDMNP